MHWRIEVPNERARLPALLDAIERALSDQGIEPAVRLDLRLIAEEVVSNAMDYGGSPPSEPQHQIVVDIRRVGEQLHVEFRDSGQPFDPLGLPPPDLESDVLDRPVGGLGVHLVRQIAESVSYSREEPFNIVRVALRAS
jgi:serine/threonine-protein kinase RsbW